MPAARAELSDAHDRVFDVARRDHHQVGQLVDDDEQVGIRNKFAFTTRRRLHVARAHCLVEVVDMAVAVCRQIVVPHLHLADDPLQCVRRLLRVRDDRRNEMRNALVRSQLDALRVDQHHAHLIWGGTHQNAGDQGVHAPAFARPGGPCHQHMGHFGQVCADISALDVLTQPHHHGVVVAAGRGRAEHVTEADHLAVGVGDLDADRRLPRDRREDADVGTRDRVRNVLAQSRDSFDLDAWAELDLVTRHGWPAHEARDLRIDLELLEHLSERRHD